MPTEAKKTTPPLLINHDLYFVQLRKQLFPKFTQLQVDSINAVLIECALQRITDIRQIAYIFATGYKEAFDVKGKQTGTIQRFVPIRELGSDTYLRGKEYWPHVGYGLVQLTWEYNFQRTQKVIEKDPRFKDVNIVDHPEQALRVDVAAFIMVYGMRTGLFTGRKLSDYINEAKCDYFNSRKIINRLDCADEIQSFARSFEACLKNSIQ